MRCNIIEYYTYIMYFIVVSNSISKIYHNFITKCFSEGIRANPVSEYPPGDGDNPQDDERDEDHIVEEVAAELTDLTGNGVAASHLLGDVGHTFIDGDPQQKQDSNPQSSCDQEPGHVTLCWTVRIGFSIWSGLNDI